MAKTIQDPLLGQALQRLFNLQGRVEPALDEIIVPTVQLADLGRGAPPPVVRAVCHEMFISPVAGELATVRLEIPGNTIGFIRRIRAWMSVAGFLNASWSNVGAALPSTAEKTFTDGRLVEVGQEPASTMTFGTQVATITPRDWRGRVPVDGANFEFDHWVIGSGRAGQFGFLELQFSTLNVSAQLSVELFEFSLV